MRTNIATTTAGGLEFRVVGPPRWRFGLGDWQYLPSRHAALLLAYLGMHGASPRSLLADTLWRGDGGRGNLRQCIHKLQLDLNRRGCRCAVLLGGQTSLQLSPGVQVDTADGFADALDRGEPGELLAGIGASLLPAAGRAWLEAQRAAWRLARAKACERAAARLRLRGDAEAARQALVQVTLIDPGNRRLVAQLAELHSQLGEPASGIGAIDRYLAAVPRSAASASPDGQMTALRARLCEELRAPRELGAVPHALDAATLFGSRRRLLAEMQQAWSAGRAFVLVGAAGSGKTQLLEHIGAPGPGVVRVAAGEGDSEVAYGTARRWLRECRRRFGLDIEARYGRELARLLPEIGPPPFSPGVEGALAVAQACALAQAQQRGLAALIVDDLHHADLATLDLLRHLMCTMPGLCFGFASRPGEAARACADAAPSAGAVVTLALPPLTLDDVQGYLCGDPDGLGRLQPRAGELLQVSDGNPWKLVDLLRRYFERGEAVAPFDQLAAGHTREDLLFPRLTPQAQAVLKLAAVAGADFSFAMAATALQLPDAVVDSVKSELAAARLLQGEAVAHDIVRHHLRARIDDASAEGLHALIAGTLEAMAATPERLAHHHGAARQWRQAAQQAEHAAARAELAGRRDRQCEWLAHAQRWYAQAGMTGAALRVGIQSLTPILLVQGSTPALSAAERLSTEATDPADKAAIEVECARIWLVRHDAVAVLRCAAAARHIPGATADTLALADAFSAVAEAWQGRIHVALAIVEPHMARIAEFSNAQVRQELWGAYGVAVSIDERWRIVADRWPEALRDAQALADRSYELDALHSLACGYGGLGQVELAIDLQRQEIRLRSDINDNPHNERVAHMNLAVNLIAIGHYAEAIDILQGIVAVAVAAGADGITYRHAAQDILAEAWLAIGRPDLALQQIGDDAAQSTVGRRLARALLRARAASAESASDAPAQWQAALDLALRPEITPIRRMRARLAGCALLPPAQAVRLCGEALELLPPGEHPVLELLALLQRARALLATGATAAARQDALRLLERAPHTRSIFLHPPELWLVCADVLRAARNRRRERACLGAARAWLLQVAQQRVPARHRDDFLQRHAVHRAVLQRADAARAT